MEIVVAAYGPEEQAMGWYSYLEETLQFPFTAICHVKRAISPQIANLLKRCESDGRRNDPQAKTCVAF
jgi:hypothetical protein